MFITVAFRCLLPFSKCLLPLLLLLFVYCFYCYLFIAFIVICSYVY